MFRRQRSRKFSLVADPVTLTWENLDVFVPVQKKLFKKRNTAVVGPKHILKNGRTFSETVNFLNLKFLNVFFFYLVSGVISSGQLVALMGAR